VSLKDCRIEVCFHSHALWQLSRYWLTTRVTESWTPARPTRKSHTAEFSYLLNSYWLIKTADIDDREHCLQGRSIVRIHVGVNATALVNLLATLKVVPVDRGDWRIDDREHCLRGRSIVTITISVNESRQCSAGKSSCHTESSIDHGDWHIDDREHCLRGRSIVTIVISGNVIALIWLHCCLGATASMWKILYVNMMS